MSLREWAAPTACPSCGHEFRARWVNEKTGDQQCPSCGHVFEATWPGFTFEPETVFIHRERSGGLGWYLFAEVAVRADSLRDAVGFAREHGLRSYPDRGGAA